MVRFFYVKYTKMLSDVKFLSGRRTLTGLIYHRPPSENSSFQFKVWSTNGFESRGDDSVSHLQQNK